MENVRMLVIGAGVNGSVCAAALYNAGINVTLLARGKRYDELRDAGIIVENSLKHKRSITKVPVIASLEPEDVFEYVLVIVRRNQVPDLLPVLARNRSPNVVFMGNNLSGPDEYSVIGKERVMMGFVFAGGWQEEGVVYALSGAGGVLGRIFGSAPFGEIDGKTTPRLTRLLDIFKKAGLNARAFSRISDYLATHAALVTIVVCFLIKHDADKRALVRSKSDLGTLVNALREALEVLPAAGYRITPTNASAIKIIPRFILVAAFRRFMISNLADAVGFWHYSDAPDEMLQLAKKFNTLIKKSGLSVPAIRKVLGPD